MIRISLVFVSCCFIFLANLAAQDQVDDESSFYYDLTSQCCPEAFYIYTNVDRHATIPHASNHPVDLMNDLPSQIHEDYHILNAKENNGIVGYRIYRFSQKNSLALPLKTVFNSRELLQFIPASKYQEIPIFQTYIETKYEPDHDAQTNGIYGLLEEMLAYYQSTKTYIDLYPYILKQYGYGDILVHSRYLSLNSSDISAYYELQLLVSWYLQLAKQNHPDVYQQLINSKQLKVLYSLVAHEYEDLVKQHHKNLEDLFANQSSAKYKMIKEYNVIVIKKREDNMGVTAFSIHDKAISKYSKMLENPAHQILNNLNIPEVTSKNFGEYLH